MFHVKHRVEEEKMTDTTEKVAVPAEWLDNSPRTERIQWHSSVLDELTEEDLSRARIVFGYTVHQWDDVDRDGNRVTMTRMDRADGRNVWLYETSYFTRVPCDDCETRWAQVFQTITITPDDGFGPVGPVARCGEHANDFRKAASSAPHVTLHESKPLRIGQH